MRLRSDQGIRRARQADRAVVVTSAAMRASGDSESSKSEMRLALSAFMAFMEMVRSHERTETRPVADTYDLEEGGLG